MLTADRIPFWRTGATYTSDDLARHAYVRLEDTGRPTLPATSVIDGVQLEFERAEEGEWRLVRMGRSAMLAPAPADSRP